MGVKTPEVFYFIRGLSRAAWHWGDFPASFEKRFGVKIQTLELPGAGEKYLESSPKTIREITDEIRKENNHQAPVGLISISMGGMIAMDWASRYPEEISHLCIINSSAGNLSLPHQRMKAKAMATISKLLLTKNQLTREEEILKLTCNVKQIDVEMIERYATFAEKYPVTKKNFFSQLMAAAKYQVPKSLSQDNFLILASENDHLVNSKCSKQISKHFQREVLWHKKAGHDLVLDDPAWMLDQFKQAWF